MRTPRIPLYFLFRKKADLYPKTKEDTMAKQRVLDTILIAEPVF